MPPLEGSLSSTELLWLSDRQVDLVTREVRRVGHQTVRLTTKEAELLAYLVQRSGRTVPRGDLLRDVWGYAPNAKTRAVDFTVRRLRQKIEAFPDEPAHVRTMHGVGYRFAAGKAPALDGVIVGEAPTLLDASVEPPEVELVGRERALARIAEAFEGGARVVTLVGPLGIGKTLVARTFTASQEGTARWVDARNGIICAVTALLGPGRDGEEAVIAVGRALRLSGPTLLTLDDVHQGPRDADALSFWLGHCPRLRLLITAPARLGLAGEHVLSLGPLDEASARVLLRARGADWDEETLSTVARRLDGLPLALELAASSDSVPTTEGQGAVLRALDQVWADVSDPLRRAWSRLAVCAGDVDLDGAEALLEDPDFIDRLDALQDRGLVRVIDGDTGVRFGLLPAARDYGRQRLGSDGLAFMARRRRWLLERWWTPIGRGHDIDETLQRGLLAEEADLLDIWANAEEAPRMALRAAILLAAARPDAVNLARLDEARRLTSDVDDRIVHWRWRASVRLHRGNAREALDDARRALAAARSQGFTLHDAHACRLVGRAMRLLGRMRSARAAVEQALEGFEEAGFPGELAPTLTLLGEILHELGEIDEAETTIREACHRARLADSRVDRAVALTALGTLLRHRRHLAGAEHAYAEALALLGPMALDDEGPAEAVEAAAQLALHRGLLAFENEDVPSAYARVRQARKQLVRLGRLRDAAEAGLAMAVARWGSGRAPEAIELFEQVRHEFDCAGDLLYVGLTLCWIGAAAADLGDVESSEGWFYEGRAILEPLSLRRGDEFLRASNAHLARARGVPIDVELAWAMDIENRDDAWGDVRGILRLLRFPPVPR